LATTLTSTKPVNRRMQWVDYARGIAILLVVYRHALVGLKMSGQDVPDFLYNIQEYALNFRMPVFFMLSGFFLSQSVLKYNMTQLMRQKISTLLYPYLLWTVILITLQIFFSAYTNGERTVHDYRYIVTQPRELEHLWYLLALFNTSALFILGWKFVNDKPVLHFLIAVGLHFLSFALKDYSLFSDPFYHYVFLLIGVYIANYLKSIDDEGNRPLVRGLLMLTLFFVAGQWFWFNYRPETPMLILPFLVIILVACAFFYCFCRLLYNLRFIPGLSFIGRNSLYIYVLHIFFISSFRVLAIRVLGIENIYVLALGCLALGIFMPIVIQSIFKRLGMWYMFRLDSPGQIKPGNAV